MHFRSLFGSLVVSQFLSGDIQVFNFLILNFAILTTFIRDCSSKQVVLNFGGVTKPFTRKDAG